MAWEGLEVIVEVVVTLGVEEIDLGSSADRLEMGSEVRIEEMVA